MSYSSYSNSPQAAPHYLLTLLDLAFQFAHLKLEVDVFQAHFLNLLVLCSLSSFELCDDCARNRLACSTILGGTRDLALELYK